jgi:HlyD family secretion protein
MKRILKTGAMLPLAFALLLACGSSDNVTGGSGLIETDEVLVSAEANGRVLERRFGEGSPVSEGDTLVVIDGSHIRLQLSTLDATRAVNEASLETARVQVKQAQTRLDFAQRELTRINELVRSGTSTQRQLDQAEFEFSSARNALDAAHSQVSTIEAQRERTDAEIAGLLRVLEDYTVVSPVTGTVTEEFIERGELLMPGRGIARISRLDTVWVKVFLNSGDLTRIKLGQSAEVDTESGGKQLTGTVVWTSNEAEFTPKNVQTRESRTDLVYAVKVSIPNPGGVLKIGMPVFVTLSTQ